MIHLLKVHQVPHTFLEQDNTEGKVGLPQNPGIHRVNPRYTVIGSGQVHVEDGVKGVGGVSSPGAYRLWSQAELWFCLYNLVVLCPLQVT